MLKAGSLALGLLLMTAAPNAWAATPPVAAPDAPMAALQAEAARLAATSGGTVGVAAWRLDGAGQKLLLNADQGFPMASTFKVAVAGRILQRVDKGEIRLDQMIDVPLAKMVPSEVIADRFIHPGLSMSVYNLLELMLTQSDNTATDLMTATAGGPAAVTAWLRDQGITGQRIDRDTNGLLREFYSLDAGGSFAAAAAAASARGARNQRGDMPNPAFDDDPRDTSTPEAMATLLTRIFSGKALSPESTSVITAIMARCRTGEQRLRGAMPPGVAIAHKTGTIGGTINDVGVITLPGGAGQVVIAVFVKKSAAPVAARERAIAEIARATYDYFLVTAPAK